MQESRTQGSSGCHLSSIAAWRRCLLQRQAPYSLSIASKARTAGDAPCDRPLPTREGPVLECLPVAPKGDWTLRKLVAAPRAALSGAFWPRGQDLRRHSSVAPWRSRRGKSPPLTAGGSLPSRCPPMPCGGATLMMALSALGHMALPHDHCVGHAPLRLRHPTTYYRLSPRSAVTLNFACRLKQ